MSYGMMIGSWYLDENGKGKGAWVASGDGFDIHVSRDFPAILVPGPTTNSTKIRWTPNKRQSTEVRVFPSR